MTNVINFKKTKVLLNKYHLKNSSGMTTMQNELYLEGHKRLEQIEFLLMKVKRLDTKLRKQIQIDLPEMIGKDILNNQFFKKQNTYSSEIEIYTESIYYFSFRLLKVIQLLPNLKRVKANGINDVRNNLIEHPESKGSLITSFSFGHIGPNGPQVKPARGQNQIGEHLDSGLYINIAEFINNLDSSLSQSL